MSLTVRYSIKLEYHSVLKLYVAVFVVTIVNRNTV